ncbi:MAG: hypothetical protein IPM32_08760 [Ignavibacteriae bacterium]|nr:hypothetical protein [Ignavibacteriota bacterium]
MPTENETKKIFEEQKEKEEIIEVNDKGNIYAPGEAPRSTTEKTVIFRDNKGEYKRGGRNARNTS